MKKVFTVLVAAAFVSLTGCKNAPQEEIVEEVILVEEIEETEEEDAEEAAK